MFQLIKTMLNLVFLTCILLSIIYSIYFKTVGPGLVAITSALVYFFLMPREKEASKPVPKQQEEQPSDAAIQEEEQKLVNERMKEKTLEVEEKIQKYFMRPNIEESRNTEPIEARKNFMVGMSVPDNDPYTKALTKRDTFEQYA